MTGLMQRTSTQRRALCIIPACYSKYVQNWVSCIVYAQWHSFHYSAVKNEGKQVLAAVSVSHCVPASVNQARCLHS